MFKYSTHAASFSGEVELRAVEQADLDSLLLQSPSQSCTQLCTVSGLAMRATGLLRRPRTGIFTPQIVSTSSVCNCKYVYQPAGESAWWTMPPMKLYDILYIYILL